ncbi:hypothetical protein ACQKKX_20525 [Neorhizobium sp. NPDC001467]|uniref:hypothetical protein n=1 Tax=Neorhizobium sp. NPDC001467 TaxID=3390595 RepID=UPI003D03A965
MTESKRHPDDYTALENWAIYDSVDDKEITNLVFRLADYGVRLTTIEGIMKSALVEHLKIVEMFD